MSDLGVESGEDSSDKQSEITAKEASFYTDIFQAVQNLRNMKNPQLEGIPLAVNKAGRMDAKRLGEIINVQNQVNLWESQSGDVVWWRTKSGAKGYFLVENASIDPKGVGGDVPKPSGMLRIERDSSKSPAGHQQGKGQISGATTLGLLKRNSIIVGLPLEYSIYVPETGNYKMYHSTPVEEVGLIKQEQLTAEIAS